MGLGRTITTITTTTTTPASITEGTVHLTCVLEEGAKLHESGLGFDIELRKCRRLWSEEWGGASREGSISRGGDVVSW